MVNINECWVQADKVIDCHGGYIVPGFIDIQVYTSFQPLHVPSSLLHPVP
jgi:adenine deaminase